MFNMHVLERANMHFEQGLGTAICLKCALNPNFQVLFSIILPNWKARVNYMQVDDNFISKKGLSSLCGIWSSQETFPSTI